MKVSQLIEILQQMPQDAVVLTHANNHDTSPYGRIDDMRVAAGTVEFGGTEPAPPLNIVLIGNWTGHLLDSGAAEGRFNYPKLREPVFAVRSGEQCVTREKIARTVNRAQLRYSGRDGWGLQAEEQKK